MRRLAIGLIFASGCLCTASLLCLANGDIPNAVPFGIFGLGLFVFGEVVTELGWEKS